MEHDGTDNVLTNNRPTATDDDEEENQASKRLRNGSAAPIFLDASGIINKDVTFDPNGENRFSLLADLEIESNKNNTGNHRISKVSTGSSNEQNDKQNLSGNKFCPPIFMYNVNVQSLVKQLESKTPKIHFKIKNVNRTKSKLYLSDANIHSEMMTLLREKKINSYSFTPREHKQISLVMRGLYHGTDIDEIKSTLDEIVPNVVSKVAKFTTPYSTKNNSDTGLFLITLLPGKKLNDISHIKFVLCQTVSWEKPKKKDKEIQCRRCQHWGHIAKNCNAEYKCVKCDQTHLPGECTHNKAEKINPTCVNCGEEGHPANWRGCSYYKEYLIKKRKRMREAQDLKSSAANNVNKFTTQQIQPGKSFASLFHNQTTTNNERNLNRPSIVETFLKLAEFFLEPEELTLEEELTIFLNEYKNKPKAEAKNEFLRLLKKVQSVHGP